MRPCSLADPQLHYLRCASFEIMAENRIDSPDVSDKSASATSATIFDHFPLAHAYDDCCSQPSKAAVSSVDLTWTDPQMSLGLQSVCLLDIAQLAQQNVHHERAASQPPPGSVPPYLPCNKCDVLPSPSVPCRVEKMAVNVPPLLLTSSLLFLKLAKEESVSQGARGMVGASQAFVVHVGLGRWHCGESNI